MKALLMTDYGHPDNATRIEDIDLPEPASHEVLIKVSSASLNPIDFKVVDGLLKPILPLKLPVRMGFDASGVVTKIGSNVSTVKVGDEVYTRQSRNNMGAFAEYTCVEEMYVAPKPMHVSFEEAASFPLVALTTLQGLKDRANAKPGMKILIHAGSGGVGTFAVQYAKHVLGLHVTATCSSKNRDLVLGLGADRVIAYDKESYLESGERYDIIYDTLGGKHTTDAFKIIEKKGVVVSISGPPDREFARKLNLNILHTLALDLIFTMMSFRVYTLAWFAGARYYRFLTESSGKQLMEIKQFVDEGKIKAVIDKVYPFDEIKSAFTYLMTGRAKGKVVIKMENN